MEDEYDLDEIQRRVNASKDEFLSAVKEYESYDGDQIIKRFLVKFEDRVDVTSELCRETEELIRRFHSITASFASKVSLVHMRLNTTAVGVRIDVIKEVVDAMGRPIQTKPGATPMEILNKSLERVQEAQDAVQTTGKWAVKRVFELGVHTEQVELTAAQIIRSRSLMMRAFKDENVGTSLQDLAHQWQKKQYKRSGNAILDAASDRIGKMTVELAWFLAEENPVVKAVLLAKKMTEAAKGKKGDTSGGGTEVMNRLLSQLRKEAKIIGALLETYEETMKEFDSVDAAIKD